MRSAAASLSAPLSPVSELLASPSARIVMVRHGVTDFTTAGKLDGRGGPDPSLSSEGRRQASAAGARVLDLTDENAPRVITSSMKRAIETGAAIAGMIGVGAQIDADWDEQSFGDWDGKSVALLADVRRGVGRSRSVGCFRQRHKPPALTDVHRLSSPASHVLSRDPAYGPLWNPCSMDERAAWRVEQG